jgi:hypothetical protein
MFCFSGMGVGQSAVTPTTFVSGIGNEPRCNRQRVCVAGVDCSFEADAVERKVAAFLVSGAPKVAISSGRQQSDAC